ncbi:hypothetical protein ACIQPQ_34610 [Streptomyces sp. NPDC091281]|uniref:hypothetical protein n=1 Tax=Streptomyces sp. NPDC091281 TaxID=3365985 RepID=UPI00380730A6
MIRNTARDAQSPDGLLLLLAASLGSGGHERVVTEQESVGQKQLVTSDCLPTELSGATDSHLEALGFVLGQPARDDPLFRPATLPAGWRREASDHTMWSHVVDEHGRQRLAVFYKAAYYDRRAFMRLITLDNYVSDCREHSRGIITDGTWATPAALAETCQHLARRAQDAVDEWSAIVREGGSAMQDPAARYVTEYTADREAYEALAARFEAVNEA